MDFLDELERLESIAYREQDPELALKEDVKSAMRQFSVNEGVLCDPNQEYLLKLGGPFDSPETVRSIANLSTVPKIYNASSTTDAADDDDDEEETARFIKVTATTRQALLTWVQPSGYEPLFIALSVARKALAADSMAPMLGIDTTMPQHRLNGEEALPRQDQYPVYYFFYGTLADTEVLRRHLDGDVPEGYYTLLPASITGGRVEMWGQYRALVDGSNQDSVVHGSAFLVQSAEHEERLRSYETLMYEVVRCRITIAATASEEERVVMGCTFRFVDEKLLGMSL
ncbi:hypothetical protein LTR56_012640 [Elasticomyces elasticus]|nr:hypothetical protein LTR56_012640 [Elasticomyces elasticus]KAK3668304.1 hypothetical protein LTR22_000989 [Elasticomyces elasticus]KAK4922795.1 hypothetical protein LTR49_009983 [Elasticomyces elasticus]KAK5769372.1 hypothetical protein LTS12_000299 [Elasticomyces elasticus]